MVTENLLSPGGLLPMPKRDVYILCVETHTMDCISSFVVPPSFFIIPLLFVEFRLPLVLVSHNLFAFVFIHSLSTVKTSLVRLTIIDFVHVLLGVRPDAKLVVDNS